MGSLDFALAEGAETTGGAGRGVAGFGGAAAGAPAVCCEEVCNVLEADCWELGWL